MQKYEKIRKNMKNMEKSEKIQKNIKNTYYIFLFKYPYTQIMS